MLRKKEIYTTTTPIPPSVPRQLAIDILHSHSEIITLSPLVLEHHPVKAPRSAPADEFYSTWYEITERVQYVPGMGKIGSGKISFKGCFHDEAWGLTTHVYAPLGIDLRNRYRIEDSPGQKGLLLCVDTELECNITLMSLVKGQQKAASKALIERFVKKAELVDAGVLQASTTEDGKLRTFNPADRSSAAAVMQPSSPLQSGFGDTSRRSSSYQMPGSPRAHSQVGSVSSHVNSQYGSEPSRSFAAELPAETLYQPYRPGSSGGNVMELPGNSSFQTGHSSELPAELKPGRRG